MRRGLETCLVTFLSLHGSLCMVPSGQGLLPGPCGAGNGSCGRTERHPTLAQRPGGPHSPGQSSCSFALCLWVCSDVDILPKRLTRHWGRLAQVCVVRPSGTCALGFLFPSWQTHTLSWFYCPYLHLHGVQTRGHA